MIIEKLKAAVRSAPPVFNLVFLTVMFVRRARGRETELDRFRQYCFRLPRMVPEPVFVNRS